jgi:DNA-binding NarL/FixJ family response regulator
MNNAAKPPIRVLLADDHTLVRAGIRALLEKSSHIQVCGEASDGREVLELVKTRDPQVILMDISMPGLVRFALQVGRSFRIEDLRSSDSSG